MGSYGKVELLVGNTSPCGKVVACEEEIEIPKFPELALLSGVTEIK